MNKDFFESQEYFLVDTFNGEIKKNKINFKIISNSKYKLNNAKEVLITSHDRDFDLARNDINIIEKTYTGFLKSSYDTYKDDLDIINSEIADLLDVSASKVYRVETNDNNVGIINIGISDKDESTITVDVLVNKLIRLIKDKGINITSWLKDYFTLPKSDSHLLINTEKDVISVIEMTINTLTILFRLTTLEQEKLRNDFIKMIFFDLISNNTNRSFDTYSATITHDIKFAGLSKIYDYNNELSPKSFYILNNVYIDKSAIFSTLYHKYYSYIKKISKGLKDNSGLYLESINLIIDNNINEEYAETIKNNYKASVDLIISLENIHSKNYSESKLDLAMTQTSINLNALNKNQMIHNKYRQKNKNKPVKVESVDEVKIIVEPKKKKSNIGNIILALIIVLLLIGVTAGIIYIISTIY